MAELPNHMDGEPPRKSRTRRLDPSLRKRAVRACDLCRRLKEKCEGGIPCKRCSHHRRSCDFSSPRTTDQGPTHYIGSHGHPTVTGEDSWEILERVSLLENILKQRVQGISLDLKSLRKVAAAEDESAEPAVHPDNEEDAINVREEKCTVKPVAETVTHFSGEFSYWNFSMRVKQHVEESIGAGADGTSQETGTVSEYWRARQLSVGSSSLSHALSCFPPREVANFLAQTFFKYAQTNYFYVEQSWLLQQIEHFYSTRQSLSVDHAASLSILLTVFAIGTQYAHLDSPDQNHHTDTQTPTSEDEIGTMFYQQATRLLPEVIESASLESVQACTLLGCYAFPVDAAGLAYTYLDLAIRLGIQNGMHRRSANATFSPKMKETRNRVWWTAFALDRKICIFHGRPISTQRSDVDSDLPDQQADLDKSEFAASSANMKACQFLILKLEEYFSEISSLRSSTRQQIPHVLKRLVEMKNALVIWWESLRQAPLEDEWRPRVVRFRASIHLRLEYNLVRMFFGRPFLLSYRLSQSNETSPTNSADGPDRASGALPHDHNTPKNRTRYREELVNDCVQAAQDALEACRQLRDNGPGLSYAAYVEYSSCRASLLVLLAYSIQRQSEEYRGLLKQGISMIREMSIAGDSARSEISLIESMERALDRLLLFFARPFGRQNGTPVNSIATGGYHNFKDWSSKVRSSSTTLNNTNSLENRSEQPQPHPHHSPNTTTNNSIHPPRPSTTTTDHTSAAAFDDLAFFASDPFSSSGGGGDLLLDPATSLAFFGDPATATDSSFSGGIAGGGAGAGGPFVHGETQMLREFLAMPGDRFAYFGDGV